jgi:serine phosphatase RsbU (regulator of sigma subunit)
VGGDFYDVLALPDGSTALAVGDIVGHDLDAAAAMGQLRSLFRACVWEVVVDGDGDLASVLTRLDRLVQALQLTVLATLFCARVFRDGPFGTPWNLSYAAAGHPPPLLRGPDGSITELSAARGLVLGVDAEIARRSETTCVLPGSILVAYTDGLVEHRGEDWDEGVERVRALLADAPAGVSSAALAELLAEASAGERHDDVAILVVGFS